jgi:hypothetical protein
MFRKGCWGSSGTRPAKTDVVAMQNQTEIEYDELKDFLSYFTERYFNLATLPSEARPIACLEVLERKSRKMAFSGLLQAIHDCVEMSLRFDHAEVAKLDSELRSRSIVTLSEVRRRYSRRCAAVMKRGRIKNEMEYYLIRNVIDDPTPKAAEERRLLEEMVSDYLDKVKPEPSAQQITTEEPP